MRNFKIIQRFYDNYHGSTVDTQMSPKETMNSRWYFEIGSSAVEIMIAACVASNIQKIERVLDLPCGHGCVLRHLVNLFSGAQLDACDLYGEGVDFCAATSGANPIHSLPELTD
ncbi:MAG: class I SAM-dependent methyltransferase [Halioglobus sp.]